ncbi:MAG TPA: Ku protein [Longimicrobiales bacterium]|nr:Ku protein [Longimicrobiales bacterium]
MEMLWQGTVTFGLVHIPVRLLPATRKRRIEFRLLHEPDQGPIGYRKVCTVEDRPVPDEEIVRGYRTNGEWIVLRDEELHAAAPVLTRTIEIRDFVDLHGIDPILFRKPYYLAPAEGAAELYVMLREALRRSDKVGIATFVLMHREHLAAIRAMGEALVLETMHYPEEIIDEQELDLPAETQLREGEIRMAVELIRNQATTFDPSAYRNEYRARVLELIRNKAAGQLPPGLAPPPPPEPTSVVDLAERLRESLERVQAERRRAA